MKKISKRVLAGSLMVIMVFLTACSGGKKAGETDGKNASLEGEGGMGRFVETDYNLPEDISSILAVNELEDGTIRILSDFGVFDSKDGGSSWEEAITGLSFTGSVSMGISMIEGAAIDSQGNIILAHVNFETYQYEYIYVSASGEEKVLAPDLPKRDDLEEIVDSIIEESKEEDGEEYTEEDRASLYNQMGNNLNRFKFTQDGRILGANEYGQAYVIDQDSGEVLQAIETSDDKAYMIEFISIEDKLLVRTSEGIDTYSLENGEVLETEAPLTEFFDSTSEEVNMMYDGSARFLFGKNKEEDTLYFCNSDGLYRYNFGAGQVEAVMNGALNSLANPGLYYKTLVVGAEGGFQIAYSDAEGLGILKSYTYSEDISTIPNKQITAYALNDNQNIRQAIANFQAANPDYYIKLEIGLTGEDGATESDAISTLNTDIMAGKGPDILLLDGMPIESYIERGLLVDLSDIADEVAKESTVFENVLNTYKSDQGSYALTSRFNVPVISGKQDAITKVSDLKTLADQVEKLREEDPDIDSILGTYSAERLLELLLCTSSPALVNEDGTVDEDELKTFLTDAKRIYENNGDEEQGDDQIIINGGGLSIGSSSENFMGILNGKQKIDLSNVVSITDFNMVYSINQSMGWEYKPLNGQAENVFIPLDTVGINSKSDMVDDCKAFIKTLFSTEMQKISQSEGFPVNVEAFDNNYKNVLENKEDGVSGSFSVMAKDDEDEDDEGESASLNMTSGTEEDYQLLKEQMMKLDTPAVTNNIIKNAILEEAADCMSGKKTINDAAASIIQTVNIYLSE